MQILISKYPTITEQKDNSGYTGYDHLCHNSKKLIAKYITENILNAENLDFEIFNQT